MENKKKLLVLVLVLLAFTVGIIYYKKSLKNEGVEGTSPKISEEGTASKKKKIEEKKDEKESSLEAKKSKKGILDPEKKSSENIKSTEESKQLLNGEFDSKSGSNTIRSNKANDVEKNKDENSALIIIEKDSQEYPRMPETDSHKIKDKNDRKIQESESYPNKNDKNSKTSNEDKLNKKENNKPHKDSNLTIIDHRSEKKNKPNKPKPDRDGGKVDASDGNIKPDLNQKEDQKEDQENKNNLDARFTVFNLSTGKAGLIKLSQAESLPKSILIGLKNTGENDGKNHAIKWLGDDYDQVINKKPGRYTLIAESLEDIVINDINYDKVKFEIKILVE